MEVLAAVLGSALVLFGVFAAGIAIARLRRGQKAPDVPPALGGLASEVDMLRLQLETLRSEMTAYNGEPKAERPRLRRYRPGQYTVLPRSLRRQVREVRTLRRAVHA